MGGKLGGSNGKSTHRKRQKWKINFHSDAQSQIGANPSGLTSR